MKLLLTNGMRRMFRLSRFARESTALMASVLTSQSSPSMNQMYSPWASRSPTFRAGPQPCSVHVSILHGRPLDRIICSDLSVQLFRTKMYSALNRPRRCSLRETSSGRINRSRLYTGTITETSGSRCCNVDICFLLWLVWRASPLRPGS